MSPKIPKPATRASILAHYESEARQHGTDAESTIKDPRVRAMEIAAIARHVKDGDRLLEIGCGNGYAAIEIARRAAVHIDGFDVTPAMVDLARRQPRDGLKGTVEFVLGDILTFQAPATYDGVYTERALQNLLSWEEQKRALAGIAAVLKPGGHYLMLESFLTGLTTLNQARAELDLPPVEMPWHNQFFDDGAVKAHMADLGCRLADEDRFLSGYYFGSRVLYPALLPKGKVAVSSSILNDYFVGMESRGDFCPMKMLRFVKS